MSFADLKKKSSLGSLTQKLVKEVEKMNNTGGGGDDRLWKPEVDKTGNGFAVLRFLPAPEGEDIPWAKMYSHAFQGPGGWYIENSLTTTGGKDPVNPSNEGKVFLFKYGKKIFDKVMEAMQPEFEDETPINPFDFWQGANFKLKIVKKDGFWNYDKSEFDSVTPLLEDEDALEALWNKEYSLSALVAADQFKSYDDLEKRLKYVLGQKPAQRRVVDESLEDESEGRGTFTPDFKSKAPVAAAPVASASADEDDALSYFQKLANE